MNNNKITWWTHAHLFANGKFNIKYEQFNEPVCDIIRGSMFKFYDREIDCGILVKPKDCTLIARSIDNMTDEEKIEWESRMWYAEGKNAESPESFLYLLSIGVLPPNFSTEGVEYV